MPKTKTTSTTPVVPDTAVAAALLAALDGGADDTATLWAVADACDEAGWEAEARAWRVVAASGRRPGYLESERRWFWRWGCNCPAEDVLLARPCRIDGRSSQPHAAEHGATAHGVPAAYVVGRALLDATGLPADRLNGVEQIEIFPGRGAGAVRTFARPADAHLYLVDRVRLLCGPRLDAALGRGVFATGEGA